MRIRPHQSHAHPANSVKVCLNLYRQEQEVLQRLHDLTGLQRTTDLVRQAILMADLHMKERNL